MSATCLSSMLCDPLTRSDTIRYALLESTEQSKYKLI
ncbi:unnamed protein product [Nezara viridula]|uniref:Uncharacterized protein n=1 Tax=Nezara viridula TaxID=85310 RepID=A0A9P0MT17_NEZVI|nr:unnamed protein product [Nezara viridula]